MIMQSKEIEIQEKRKEGNVQENKVKSTAKVSSTVCVSLFSFPIQSIPEGSRLPCTHIMADIKETFM